MQSHSIVTKSDWIEVRRVLTVRVPNSRKNVLYVPVPVLLAVGSGGDSSFR